VRVASARRSSGLCCRCSRGTTSGRWLKAANGVEYALTATIWSEGVARARHRELEAGFVYINKSAAATRAAVRGVETQWHGAGAAA